MTQAKSWDGWLNLPRDDYNSDGFAITTWSTCGRCGGKISPRNRNEATQGFHNRCMTYEIQYSDQPVRLKALKKSHQLTLTLLENK